VNKRQILSIGAFLFLLEYSGLVLLKAMGHGPLFSGSPSYGQLGEEIVQIGKIDFLSRPPLYPAFLASIISIFGPGWQIFALALHGLAFIFLGLITMTIAYELAGGGTRSLQIMTLAGLLYAGNILFALESLAQRETVFFSIILLLAIYMSVFSSRHSSLLWYSAIGVLCAAGHLIRPNGFVLAFCITVYLAIARYHDPMVIRARSLGIFLITFLLFVLPWQIHLSRMAGSATLAPAESAGISLWKGTHPEMEEFFPWVDMDVLDPLVKMEIDRLQLPENKIDDHFIELSRENAEKKPLFLPLRFLYKFAVFFLPIPTPFGTGDVNVTSSGLELVDFKPNLRVIVAGTPYLLLLFAGVVMTISHTLLLPRSARSFLVLSVFVTVMFAFSFSMTFTESRYRLPFEIEFAIISAFGLVILLERLRLTKQVSEKFSYA